MRNLRVPLWIGILLLFSLLPGMAQDMDGSSIIEGALAATDANCDSLSRDQACYGHGLLFATSQLGADPFDFEAEGDRVDLSQIQSLKLSGLDVEAGTWGVTLLELRANLPSSRPENVTLLAFGDVALTNNVSLPTSAEVQVRTQEYVNVRLGPSVEVGVAGVLAPGQTVTAVERLADSSWLRVRLPDSDKTGWLFADLVTSEADLSSLNVSDRNAPYYEPMQAFYFESGAADVSEFERVPSSGLLIQTPEGVGEVQLLINEINVQIGSTVYFQAQPNGMMTVATLEGHADVSALGFEQTAFAGTQVTVRLNENSVPMAAPNPPEPYDMAMMEELPIGQLQRDIEITPPMTVDEIEAMLEEQAALNNGIGLNGNGLNGNGIGLGVCCPAESETEIGSTCEGPGQSCNAPGHGGTCPGNSCENPGQGQGTAQGKDKKDKKEK